MEEFLKSPIENVKIFPSMDDMNFWKVLMIGPPDTSYNYGCFLLSVRFTSNYPFSAPQVKFIT